MMIRVKYIFLNLLLPIAVYSAGFPNVPQTAGTLISGLNAPQQGRTAVIAFHNGLLYTVPEIPSSQPGSDAQVRVWDIANPALPVELAQLGITQHPVQAHGYFKQGPFLSLGPNWPPESPWAFEATGTYGINTRTSNGQWPAVARGYFYQPLFVGPSYWTYSPVGDTTRIERIGINGVGREILSEWDHLEQTGVLGFPFIVGNILIYAADQTRTGVATYDISDLENPVLLDVLKTGGPGGYWASLWGGNGKLYVVFPYRSAGNGMRVVDVTDPSDIQFVTDVSLPGAECMYTQFQDHYAFLGSHKVDMNTFQSVLSLDVENVLRTNDGGVGVDTSQFLLPIGNLLVTGGSGPNQGMAIWAHQDAPDTNGPTVGFHIPRAGQLNYPLTAPISLLIHETLETSTISNGTSFIVQPLGGSPIAGNLTFAFEDTLTFVPQSNLLADTTYEVILADGGIQDVAGNGMEEYTFSFSTGSTNSGNLAPVISTLTASPYPAATNGLVTFNVTASDPEASPIEYRYDLGDGSASSSWITNSTHVGTYTSEGHFFATVQVRDTNGTLATKGTTVTVLTPITNAAPSKSSQIVCNPSNATLYVVNPDNDTLTALSSLNQSVIWEVAVGQDPRSVALDASSNLWVTCHDSDEIQILSATGNLLDSIDTGYGSTPFSIVFSPDRQTAYVSMYGSGELRSYHAATHTELNRLTLGPTPRALAISGNGSRLLVTRFISPLHFGEIWDVNTTTLSLNATLRIPKFGDVIHQDGTASGRGVANYLAEVLIMPDEQYAWVSHTKVNVERGLFFAEDLDDDNTVRTVISRIDLNAGTYDNFIDVDNSDSAYALATSPFGDYLFLSQQGNNSIAVFDMLAFEYTAGMGALTTRLGTELAPQGLCMDPVTQRLVSKNLMDRSVTFLDLADFFATGNISITSSNVPCVLNEKMSPEVLLGKQVFYNASDQRMSGEGYMSCATCHSDGGTDGRTWDFTGRGEGFRNTTTLRGKSGVGQGLVHWSANFDEIQDFENDIRNGFGGNGFLSLSDWTNTMATLGPSKAGLSAELDALSAYVTSLSQGSVPRSPHRRIDGEITLVALAGKALVQQMNCASCHSGFTLTDSSFLPTLHDVGTMRTSSGQRLAANLSGIDTPTLKGVWNTAPYFHDGSATNIMQVFHVAGGTVYQAELAVAQGGASISTTGIAVNYDNTVHGTGLGIAQGGGSLIFQNIDGGSGGIGAIEFRCSNTQWAQMSLTVNGTNRLEWIPPKPNSPTWRSTHWDRFRFEGVELNAGTNNTLSIANNAGFYKIEIDDMLVSTADDLALAQPHRQVLNLSSNEIDQVIAYLLQLDSNSENPLAASSYEAWVIQQGLVGTNALENTDQDGDLNINLGEYVFDTDPDSEDAGGIIIPLQEIIGPDTFFVIDYRRATHAQDIENVIQHSVDLIAWNDLVLDGVNNTESIIDANLDGDDTAERVRIRVRMQDDETRMYFRIRIEKRVE